MPKAARDSVARGGWGSYGQGRSGTDTRCYGATEVRDDGAEPEVGAARYPSLAYGLLVCHLGDLGERQSEPEGRAFSNRALDPDLAAVGLDDGFADIQA